MQVDCTQRGDYLAYRHTVIVEAANEALSDVHALVFDPDYASLSGRSVRTIGWSDSAGHLLTVITVTEAGVTYGVIGWPSNEIDMRHYRESREGDDHEQ